MLEILAKDKDTSCQLQALLDERTLDLPTRLLDLLPVGVYVCDHAGVVVRYNRAAAELWGCSPQPGDRSILYCGSYRLIELNGTLVPHAKCPMADVLATGHGLRDQEIAIERANGSRIVALMNIEPIKDGAGRIVGAVNVFREKPEPRGVQMNGGAYTSNDLLQALPAAVYTTDAAGHITFFNEAAAELWGCRPELGKSEFCGSWKLYWPDGTPLPHAECPMALALREKRPIRGLEAIAERPDGTRVPFIPYPTPLFDASGTLIGAVNTLVDITERYEVDKHLRESEIRYRRIAAIVESSDDAILTKNLDGVITSWNSGAERLFGYTADEVVGKPVTILIPVDRRDEEPAILARIRRGERVDHYETIRQRKDGSLIDISLTISPVRDPDGRIIGASKIARDISERRRADERQRIMLREMDHRVKNLFALASGVVSLSTRSATSVETLSSSVRARLSALAHAHALTLPVMTDSGLRMEQSTTLHALIHVILAPYGGQTVDDRARVTISGPDIPIAGGSLTSLALLLHEFATNAAKYGALSTPNGHIDIECIEDGVRFNLAWNERNGPPVQHQTDREGFGTKLALSTVQGQLGGEISRDWNPDGLRIRLSISRNRVAN